VKNKSLSRTSLEDVSAARPSSVDVYRGFCALYNVISYIVDSQPSASHSESEVCANTADGQVLPSKLASAGHQINSVVSSAFRLEIIEDVFSLLFSRIEHLRDSEDSPDRQTDSEPEMCEGDVLDPKLPEVVSAELNVISVPDVAHEIPSPENPRVGALTVESRCSPLETSSSSHDGRSDELSGSQTVSNSSMQSGNESGFLVQDSVIRDVLLLLCNCCEVASKLVFLDDDRQTVDLVRPRLEALQQHISDAQWRLRITTAPSVRISALSEHHPLKQRRLRDKGRCDSATYKVSDVRAATSDYAHTENTDVPIMLCRPESLLNLCLTEGRIADAEEVVKVCH